MYANRMSEVLGGMREDLAKMDALDDPTSMEGYLIRGAYARGVMDGLTGSTTPYPGNQEGPVHKDHMGLYMDGLKRGVELAKCARPQPKE